MNDTQRLVDLDVNELTRDLHYCLHCSLCKGVLPSETKSARFFESCPAGAKYKFDAYFGSGRAGIARAVLTGEIGFEDSPRLPEVVYTCTQCGSCTASCRYSSAMGQVDHERANEIVRARCVEEGLFMPEHGLMVENMRREDNVFGEPKSQRGSWAKDLNLKDTNLETVDVLFHAGCRLSYDDDLRSVARSTAAILEESGLRVGIAGNDEACCGGRAFVTGFQGEFVKYADDMVSRLRASGAKCLVTACSDCFYSFKRLYPLVGRKLDVEVLHVTQYAHRLMKENKLHLTRSIPLRVAYHDPCQLGRRMFPDCVYDEPRALLKEVPGVELVEMERTQDTSWCCGAGGGVLECNPELNEWTARERVMEALASGAQALVTACPWCERNFKDSVGRMEGVDLKIYDVTELIREAKGA